MSLVIRPHTTGTGAILTHPVLYVNVLLRKDDCGVTSEPTLMIVVLPYNTETVCTNGESLFNSRKLLLKRVFSPPIMLVHSINLLISACPIGTKS